MGERFGGVDQERMRLAERYARIAGSIGAQNADGLVRTILEISNRNRLEGAKAIIRHLEEGEFAEALFVLKIFGNGSGGFFSGTEKKYLQELIEALAPPGEKEAIENSGEEFGGLAPTDMNRFLNTQDKPQ